MKIKNIIVPAAAIIIMAAILLGVSLGTDKLRAENIQNEHIAMMRMLLPGSESFVVEPYAGDDVNIRSVHKAENGFVIETGVYGCAGEIIMMVGVNNDGRVTGVVVRDMEETLGLGRNALTDHEFLFQFLNTSGNVSIASGAAAASFATSEETTAAEGDTVEVDAITGATVTSKAIARSINSAVAVVTGADAASSATTWGG